MSKKNEKITGCKLDFVNETIIVNKKFAAAMKEYGSKEYKFYQKVKCDFPHFETIIKAGRTYTKPRKNKRFSYANMEKYISTFDNADELLQRFILVQVKSKVLKSPYKYVSDWFRAQFPDYEEIPDIITKKEHIFVKPAPDTNNYEKKVAQKELLKMNNHKQSLFQQ